MKSTLKITSKGQVTLRKEVLDQLGVKPGDKVTVEPVGPGRVEIRAAKAKADLEKFFGCLKNPRGRKLTLEQINRFAREGWAGKR
jgi:AbrB family looped-hinge helix DNA binding protein